MTLFPHYNFKFGPQWSPIILLLIASLLIMAIIVWAVSPTPALNDMPVSVGKLTPAPAPTRLQEETLKRGIRFMHTQISKTITGLDEALGSGACAFDMDNDHDMDIYLVGGSGQQRYYGKKSWWAKKRTGHLYRNRGDGFFDDVTEQSNLAFTIWGMGCNVADFNLDGFVDLMVTGREHNVLFKNNGNGRFTQIPWDKTSSWSTSAAIGDYNNDGYMDIYVGNYLNYDNTAKQFEALSGYDAVNAEFNAQNYQAAANQLYTNKGNFNFFSQANEMNIANADGRTLAAKWFNANEDSWLDLLVLNDSGSITQLYLNRDGKSFDKATLNRQLDLPSGIRDGALQDYDNDGEVDLILSTQLGDSVVLLKKQQDGFQNVFWQHHSNSEMFSGLSGYGVQFIDLNNDGELDIYHANGLKQPDPDSPAISAGQPDVISLGDGQGNFILDTTSTDKLWHIPLSTRSVITLDVDNDGDKDLLLTANNNPARLIINQAPVTHWIGFSLIDHYGNRGNFQKLIIKTNQRQRYFFNDNDTFLGHSDDRITLALKVNEVVEKISIHWADGEITTFDSLSNNAYHVIQQNIGFVAQYGQQNPKKIKYLPQKLALWQLKTGQYDPEEIYKAYDQAEPTQRLELIATILKHDSSLRLLAILKLALSESEAEIVIAAIDALKQLELEQSYYWLAELFKHRDSQVLCRLADTFRHFFIEEEAFIQRKALAVPHLIRLLGHADSRVVVCAILALAESKSVRAVVPIEQLLLSSNNNTVLIAAIYALGELRHTRSIEALLSLATDQLDIRRARLKALRQLNKEHTPVVNFSTPPSSSLLPDTTPLCPAFGPEAIFTYQDKAFATLLNACSPMQQLTWFDNHRKFVVDNYALYLNNRYFESGTFTILLGLSSNNQNIGITKILLTLLQKRHLLTGQIALIKSLQQRLPQPAIEKILKYYLENKTNSKELRIAAGDALINSYPQYVMKYADELFNE